MFKKAERTETFTKLAIAGPSGSGKTYSALRLARGLVGPAGRIAFIDTENRSATLYAELTDFDHCDIAPPFEYRKFIDAVKEAEKAGYDCVIIDSASHLWQGILNEKDNIDKRGGNQYTNWSEPTKHFNETVQAFLQSRIHTISCLRSKTEYVLQESTNRHGKAVQTPVKVGLAPIIRDGIEYEFTTVFDVLINHESTVSKDRTGLFTDRTFLITEEAGEQIAAWLKTAKPLPPPPDHTPAKRDFLERIRTADAPQRLDSIGKEIASSGLLENVLSEIREAFRQKRAVLNDTAFTEGREGEQFGFDGTRRRNEELKAERNERERTASGGDWS